MKDTSRLGFHYFPDTLHYRQVDLETWLPELLALRARWLVLLAPLERAIPENFLSALLQAGIEPILHIHFPLGETVDRENLRLLFGAYASWGVKYVILFDRPNLQSNWSSEAWFQEDLVERFLDRFLPLAALAIEQGLRPVFPPLQPGGDYWDLAFLRTALSSLQRRQAGRFLNQITLAAYAGSADRPLDWGAGGPSQWPDARPYHTPAGSQDHRGLHVYEWIESICQVELGRVAPLFLLGMGSHAGDAPAWGQATGTLENSLDEIYLAERTLAILSRVAPSESKEVLPPEVQNCCFWLLAAQPGACYAEHAWFLSAPTGAQARPVANQARRWLGVVPVQPVQPHSVELDQPQCEHPTGENPDLPDTTQRTISHYILLPLYAWGASAWDMEAIAPLLQGEHPTVGFSLEEARQAARVTVVGGGAAFSEDALDFLRQSGCVVESLQPDGTLLAI